VAATDDPAVIHSLGADCAVYMPRALEIEHVVALLEAGTNVVTTRGELFGGGHNLGDELRARVVAACTRGNSSIYATGSSPGFITETFPFALLSMQRHVESIEIDEFADMSQRDSPHLLFELMGFGRALDSYNPGRAAYLVGEFSPSLALLADAARRPVDEWSGSGAVAAARTTTRLAAGDLPAGTVGAQRTTVVGKSGGETVIQFSANWYCTTDLEPAWDLRSTGWRVRVRGDAPMDIEIAFPVPLAELGAMTPALTANRPVNAVPYVCAARPGILSTTDLPVITPAGP
jgi:4-hydroxy-tetrahydrodipicolinate reductase